MPGQRAMRVRVEVAQVQRRRHRGCLHHLAGCHEASHTSARLLMSGGPLDSCKQEGLVGPAAAVLRQPLKVGISLESHISDGATSSAGSES